MRAHQIRRMAVALAVVVLTMGGSGAWAEDASYLFAYFTGNGEDGLHLASSKDAFKWQALNGGKSYLKPEVGESKLMRDPCLFRGPDGTYHLVWTTAWKGKTIGHASSKDLIHWSEQKALPVMESEPDVVYCWAPEVAYDSTKEEYVIFWASTVRGKFTETADTEKKDNNPRIYVAMTKDFETFSAPKLFYDPGFPTIDATFLSATDGLYLVIKNETLNPAPQKNIRIAKAESIQGPFGELSEPITPKGEWAEGPTALKVGDDYVVFYDSYRKGHYGAVRSKDLKTWEDITGKISFPPGARHGTVIQVPGDTVQALTGSGQ